VTAPLVLNPLMAKMVMYLAGRGGLAGTGMTLHDLGGLGYRIVADPSTPLLAAYAAWKKVYQDLARGFGADIAVKPDWSPVERDMRAVIELEKLLAVERATVETGTA
jgi:2-methylisocitrate lyase-like PEP mutase family enzyme